MTEATTETETATTSTAAPELPDPWRRVLRLTLAAIVIALSGLVLGGVAVWVQWQEVRRESAQTAWDQQTAARKTCTDLAASRLVTRENEARSYEADMRQIAGRLDTVDLLESIALLFPPGPVIDGAMGKIAESRGRIQVDGVKRTADFAAFNDSRPPLDAANCPKAPTGPRP